MKPEDLTEPLWTERNLLAYEAGLSIEVATLPIFPPCYTFPHKVTEIILSEAISKIVRIAYKVYNRYRHIYSRNKSTRD